MEEKKMKVLKKTGAIMLMALMSVMLMTGCGGSEGKDQGETSGKALKVIDVDLSSEEYAFGVDKDQPELLKQTNDFIKEIVSNGKFDEICNHYFGDGEPVAVTSAAPDESKDQLVVATNAGFEPFEYTKGDKYLGIDMEIADALAKKLGKELVIQNMDFDAVCLSIGQHKCDIAMSGLTIKESRRKYVEFTDPYYNASQRLIVKGDDTEFDAMKDAASINAALMAKDSSVKIGVQNGTTGKMYCEGDEEAGFEKLPVSTVGYKNGSLACQDMINGNIDYVIIDSAPAKCITDALNSMN
ncbi:MAG TPA: amino acid ABC transporter substrate-binding protein [Lachnospiraceae bacterium]|nr:amino acid ABC transporter substrate-binding protein [Lachnospiraceae bacterium]